MATTEDDFLRYPKAQMSLGAGDLVQVTNFKLTTKNNAKTKHTLRRNGAGSTLGTTDAELSFDMEVDERGQEREYAEMLFSGTAQTVRIKLPGGKVVVFTGVVNTEDLDQPLDDALKVSISMNGRRERRATS